LFSDVAPRSGTRQGGYVRIVKLGLRQSDSAPMAFLEWVDQPVTEPKIDLDEKAEKNS
jgi:large subunit ribosomal protein L17